MGFIAGTQVFTDTGFKPIEEVSGRDKVLVRNFIGYAEFIQPFYVKKKRYTGEIVNLSSRNFLLSVTPEHKILYDSNGSGELVKYKADRADEIIIDSNNRIQRHFKYRVYDPITKEMIRVGRKGKRKQMFIDAEDWYQLVAFTLVYAQIDKLPSGKYGTSYAMRFNLRGEELERDMAAICALLDKYSIGWSIYNNRSVIVSYKNNLANKLRLYLGSKSRKEMYLPHSMIFNSTRKATKLFLDTYTRGRIEDKTKRQSNTAESKKLMESISVLAVLGGYNFYSVLNHKAGTLFHGRPIENDTYYMFINKGNKTEGITGISKEEIDGHVYSIGLLEGQVFVKSGRKESRNMAVWVNPE